MDKHLHVEVAYAQADEQLIVAVELAAGATVMDAIQASHIQQRFAGMDVREGNVGIFGQHCSLQRLLDDGDRVEIYRPLQVDPKQARRLRAQQQQRD